MRVCSALALALLVMMVPALAGPPESGSATPPPELVRLEREIGLRVAHARDEGPVEPAKQKLLSDAQQDELKGEQALKAGNLDSARDYFEQAGDALKKLGL